MGKGREDQSGEGQSHGHSHAHSHTPPYQGDQADKQKKGEKGETTFDQKHYGREKAFKNVISVEINANIPLIIG